MSIASISYGSLEDASSAAKNVAKKLDKYADSLYSSVYKKLNKYEGTWNANISTAWAKTNDKITELRAEQDQYETYASDLITLCEECENTDQAVKSKIASLTSSFKKTHDIADNPVVNCIAYVVTAWGNDTVVGRWIGDKVDQFEAADDYHKSAIKEWYNYEGGKELIKGVIIGALEIAIAVLGIVATILSGGTFAILVALVGGLIGVANGLANIWNEQKAYSLAQNGDPATGRRRSNINSWQDYLRSSFIFDESGDVYEYNEFYNDLATGIDIVSTTCAAITAVTSGVKVIKKGFKWVTANLSNIKSLFAANGLATVKDICTSIFHDMGKNLKAEFWDFKNIDGSINLKSACSSMKNILNIPKELLKGENVFKVGFDNILMPAITVFNVDSTEPPFTINSDGQVMFDLTENITLDKVMGAVKLLHIPNKFAQFVDANSVLNFETKVDIFNKFSLSCDISIAIPTICFPNITMPIIRFN